MSGSRRSRFQGGLEERAPRSHPSHHHHPQQQRLRNPWVAHESQSTSSSSGRTHRGNAGPADALSRPIRPPHLHLALSGGHPRAPHYLQPTFYGLSDVPAAALPAAPAAHDRPHDLLHPPPPASRPVPACGAAAGESSSTGSRIGTGSAFAGRGGRDEGGGWESPGGWSGGGCGGRCAALDDFCFHCLRVAFVAGVVGGVALVIAGAILHSRLLVLVYIGGLTAAVSLMLLGVHCCVRRDHVRRKRRLRQRQRRQSGGSRRGSRGGEEGSAEDGVPLREMAPALPHHHHHHQNRPPHPTHPGSSRGTAQPVAYHGLVLNPPPPPAAFRSTIATETATDACTDDLEVTSHTGKSLWRQKERRKPEIVESHH